MSSTVTAEIPKRVWGRTGVKTANVARDGSWERYKTSHYFDSTEQNPSWLG